MSILIIFLSLMLFILANFPINLFFISSGNDREFESTNLVGFDFSAITSIPKITAKSVDNSIIITGRLLDEVYLDNLERTVRDLSSFHTRHTESEFIDDAAYWLTNKLQNVCGTDVYVQNFKYIPEKTNYNDDKTVRNSNNQEPSTYNLKNIACEKPGSTNNTIIISAHYDSRMELREQMIMLAVYLHY